MFQTYGIIDKVETKKDNSIKIIFITAQELSAGELAEMLEYRNKEGFVAFKETAITTDEMPADVVPENRVRKTDRKSQSQKLRAVLYRVWESKGIKVDFDTYYRQVLDSLIEYYKGKIEE